MKIREQGGLPYVSVTLRHQEREVNLENVVLDTGAAVSIFRTDDLEKIGLLLSPDDEIHEVQGVGGRELTISKRIDAIRVGELQLQDFMIDMGALAYGFDIDGLLGFDFLQQVGAIIDFGTMEIKRAE